MVAPWKIRLLWTQLLLALILVAIRVLDRPEPGLNFLPPLPRAADYDREEAIRLAFYEVLLGYGIRVDWISGDSRNKIVRIPIDLPVIEPYTELAARFRELGAQILQAESDALDDNMTLALAVAREPFMNVFLRRDASIARAAGRIALVIDDFGYTFNSGIEKFLQLQHTFTVSIIPGLKYSAAVANAAHERNRQVMIHLPMQPKNDKIDRDDFVLLTEMGENEIRNRVRRAINAIPHAVGLNNHMGSLATENDTLLAIMMAEVSKTGLFFLDSRTDPSTRAHVWARQFGIPTAVNDVFLDAIHEKPFIRQQILSLAEIAGRRGFAIAIGHPQELTLKVLQEELPKLEKRGFRLVNVSEMMK
jgi:hypothetical protein